MWTILCVHELLEKLRLFHYLIHKMEINDFNYCSNTDKLITIRYYRINTLYNFFYV